MSAKNTEGNNVLPFIRPAKHGSATSAATAELRELLRVYDHLIALLRETYDEGLDRLADNIVASVVACREAMASGLDDKTGPELVKKMRQGLHEMPQTLRSLLPGIGPRLGESMERKLGIQFSRY
ncbi:MAG TPA: hypothetical protein VL381_06715 [Rhodocyclaceae bacterium]|nr:hypothetical protein [Rhodocyclaceae bacterium]